MILKQIEDKTRWNTRSDYIEGTFIGMVDPAPMRNGHAVGPCKAYAFKVVNTEKNEQDDTINMYCQPVSWSTPVSIREDDDACSLQERFLYIRKFLGQIEFIDLDPEPDTMWVDTMYDPSKQYR